MSYIDLGLVAPTLTDPAAAAANTTKLQAALTAGGRVQFVGNGTAYINAPLVIGSNTELNIPPGLTIKQASGANNNLLRNAAYNAAWNTLYDNGGSVTTGPLAMIWSGSVSAWAQSTAYAKGAYVSANGNLYWCASAGTSLGSGAGPSGNGSGIVDNSATWNYVTTYPSSVSGAGQLTAIVHWAAHGATVGKALWVTPQPDGAGDNHWTGTQTAGTRGGPCDSAYFGVFYVAAVNDSNYMTVTLRRVPAADFSGIPVNVKYADQNIVINCNGTLDYDTANQSPVTSQALHAAILAGVMGLKINGLNAINVAKYVLNISGVSGFDIGHVQGGFAGSGSDQVKAYGPVFDGVIHDVYGTGGDDVLSLQTAEPAAFYSYIIANGDILGVTVRRIGNASGAGVSLLPDHALLLMDNISIEEVTTHDTLPSNRVSPIKITADVSAGPIGMLRLRGIEGRDGDIGILTNQGTGSFSIDHLIMDACSTKKNGSSGRLVDLFASATTAITIKKLTIKDCEAILRSTSDHAIFIHNAAGGTVSIEKADIEKCYFYGATQGYGYVFTTGGNSGVTLGKITIADNDIANLSGVGNTIFGDFDFVGNKIATCNGVITTSVAGTNLRFSRNTWDGGMYNGVVRFNAAVAINVYSDGMNTPPFSSTIWFTYPSAGTATMKGWDIQADITKAVRTVGSYFYNTNAAPGSGTIAAVGPVMNDGTTGANSFHLMADPTKVF